MEERLPPRGNRPEHPMSSYTVTIHGESYTVHLRARHGSTILFTIDEREYEVTVDPSVSVDRHSISISHIPKGSASRASTQSTKSASPEIKAPLPGIVSDLKVAVGDKVSAGATLVVIEAMKMENPIKAPADATITAVHVKKGAEVAHGALLITLGEP